MPTTNPNTIQRYGAVAQVLHWSVMLLVLTQIVLGVVAYNWPITDNRLDLLHTHRAIGITIFVLMLIRLGWRFVSPPPPLPASITGLHRLAANGTHVAMYGLLLAMPVVGWLYCCASQLKLTWFGLFTLPNPIGPNATLAVAMKMLHMDMAGALVTLIGMHIGAAIWHQFVQKDNLLIRMLPVWRAQEVAETQQSVVDQDTSYL